MNDKVVEYISKIAMDYRGHLNKYEFREKMYFLVTGFMDALNVIHVDFAFKINVTRKLVDFLFYNGGN